MYELSHELSKDLKNEEIFSKITKLSAYIVLCPISIAEKKFGNSTRKLAKISN